MIWWYEDTISRADAYAALSREPERPSQKHTRLEYSDMAKQANVQAIKDLSLIQRLCRQANNLCTTVIAQYPEVKLVDATTKKQPRTAVNLRDLDVQ